MMAKKVKAAAAKRVNKVSVVSGATRVLVAARRAWGNPWHMAGTEGTGKYTVLAITSRGRVGVRELGNSARIRVEPLCKCGKVGAVLTAKAGWKQPGDGNQNRFSKVVYGTDRDVAITLAQKVLGVDKLVTVRPPAVQTESPVAVETSSTEGDEEIPF